MEMYRMYLLIALVSAHSTAHSVAYGAVAPVVVGR